MHFQKSCLQNLWCCILFLSPTIIPTGFYGCFNLCHSQRETICFRTLWLWADSLNNGTTTDSWHLPTLCSEHIFYVHYRQVCNLEVESKLLERREAMIGEYRYLQHCCGQKAQCGRAQRDKTGRACPSVSFPPTQTPTAFDRNKSMSIFTSWITLANGCWKSVLATR